MPGVPSGRQVPYDKWAGAGAGVYDEPAQEYDWRLAEASAAEEQRARELWERTRAASEAQLQQEAAFARRDVAGAGAGPDPSRLRASTYQQSDITQRAATEAALQKQMEEQAFREQMMGVYGRRGEYGMAGQQFAADQYSAYMEKKAYERQKKEEEQAAAAEEQAAYVGMALGALGAGAGAASDVRLKTGIRPASGKEEDELLASIGASERGLPLELKAGDVVTDADVRAIDRARAAEVAQFAYEGGPPIVEPGRTAAQRAGEPYPEPPSGGREEAERTERVARRQKLAGEQAHYAVSPALQTAMWVEEDVRRLGTGAGEYLRGALRGEGPRAERGLVGAAMGAAHRQELGQREQRGQEQDRLMAAMGPYKWEYEQAAQQGMGLPEGQQYGPMAQELEGTELGQAMVRDTPGGKVIDQGAATRTMLGLQGRIAERQDMLEAQLEELQRSGWR